MKATLLSLIMIFVNIFSLKADLCTCKNVDSTICLRVSDYHPFSKTIRKIYGSDWVDYQLEVTTPLTNVWHLWGAIGITDQKGKSIGFHDRTTLRLIPLSLGIKHLFSLLEGTDCYIGGGLCYSFLSVHDYSSYVPQYTHKQAVGGVLQLGIYTYLSEKLFFNACADYFYQRFHFSHSYSSPYVENRDLDMSGIKLSLGLGILF